MTKPKESNQQTVVHTTVSQHGDAFTYFQLIENEKILIQQNINLLYK